MLILGAVQAFIPLISSPIFGNIYRSTVETMPNLFMLIIAGLFLVNLSMLIIVDRGLLKVQRSKAKEEEKIITSINNKVGEKDSETA